MPEQHRMFFEALPMLMVGALAPSTGQVVPLALTGAPGFVQTPTQTSLAITPDQLLDPGAPCARASALDGRQARCGSWGPLPGQQHAALHLLVLVNLGCAGVTAGVT